MSKQTETESKGDAKINEKADKSKVAELNQDELKGVVGGVAPPPAGAKIGFGVKV